MLSTTSLELLARAMELDSHIPVEVATAAQTAVGAGVVIGGVVSGSLHTTSPATLRRQLRRQLSKSTNPLSRISCKKQKRPPTVTAVEGSSSSTQELSCV